MKQACLETEFVMLAITKLIAIGMEEIAVRGQPMQVHKWSGLLFKLYLAITNLMKISFVKKWDKLKIKGLSMYLLKNFTI